MFELFHVHDDIVATKRRGPACLQRVRIVQKTSQGKTRLIIFFT